MKYSLWFMFLFAVLSAALKNQTKPIYGKHQLIAYVIDWNLPETIAWKKLDHVAYAFAIPHMNGELKGFNSNQLRRVVNEAHRHGKGVSLAVGGWTGSLHFSSLLGTAESRKKFANELLKVMDEYNFNGFNIDWEYPNDPNGVSCNQKNPNDTANLLAFMQLLRENLEKLYPHEHKLLTSAVKTNPFNDENQLPIKHLSKAWAEVMDAFYIMNYDITGSFSDKALPMAPLFNSHRGEPTWGEKAIKEWESAGIPSERIFLGLPFYGYTQMTAEPITNSTGLGVPLYKKRGQIKGDGYDSKEKEPCPHSVASYSGEYQWRSIVRDGVASNSSGWETFWDKASQSPFAYNRKKSQYVTFEDPTSARLKAKYIRQKHLGGAMLWSLEMDDASNSLLNALQGVRT